MDDPISRQAAIDVLDAYQVMVENGEENPYAWARERMCELSSAQPEITDEQAIKHLQSSGWMQNHDKQMYEMGLKEQLADDSGSYDALLPSTQPTLYGYKIEHLVYIAMVMEKEGVTADYAVRTFYDMSRAIKMIIDEVQQKVEEALNG